MVAEKTRTIAQIERDLDLAAGLVYKWQRRYRVQEERLQPSEERAEQAELRRLKRELEVVKQERDILKNAIRVFSRGSHEPLPVYRRAADSISLTAAVCGAQSVGGRVLQLAEAHAQPTRTSQPGAKRADPGHS